MEKIGVGMALVVAAIILFTVSKKRRPTMTGDFAQFLSEFPTMSLHRPKNDAEAFVGDEFARFRSIAGTLLSSFPNVATSIDERIISHILLRSLLENYFWILYIFDNSTTLSQRFDEYLNGFRREYDKLYADLPTVHQSQLTAPPVGWAQSPKPMDMKSLLAAVRNIHGHRLDYLYFVYRITSFDTHGKCQKALFGAAFGAPGNFPFLKIDFTIDLIANQYLVVWQSIKEKI